MLGEIEGENEGQHCWQKVLELVELHEEEQNAGSAMAHGLPNDAVGDGENVVVAAQQR
jgi:hypothetical protein